jgi:hypothetical protein
LQGREFIKQVKDWYAIKLNSWIQQWARLTKNQLVGLAVGSVAEVLTIDALGSHGSRPSLTVIEELSHHRDLENLQTLLDDAVKGGGLLVWTNMGSTNSAAFKLRELARMCETGRWKFFSHSTVAPWISKEKVAERARFASQSRFLNMYGGQWTPDMLDGIGGDLIHSRIVLDGPHHSAREGLRYYIGCDSGVVKDAFSCVCLGVDPARRKIIAAEDRAFRPPVGGQIDLEMVEEFIRDMGRRFRPRKIRIDRSHFFGGVQSLRRDLGNIVEGVSITAGTLRQFAEAVLSVFHAGQIELYPGDLADDLLKIEIANCGAYDKVRADRDSSGHADLAFGMLLALLDATDALRFGDDYDAPSSEFVASNADHGINFGGCSSTFRYGVPFSARDPDHEGWTQHTGMIDRGYEY